MSEEIGELFNTITTIYINDRPVQAKLPSALQDSVIRKIDGKYYIEYGILDYIEHLQQKVEQLEKEIDKLNKEYERIYNENCKLRENHNINDIILLDENERLNNIINRIDNFVDRTIEVIKHQPSDNDEWILERLNGIKYLTELKENK